MNILLVDDHSETCETLARFLTRLGYAVKVTSNGSEALQEYARDDFPLVISDIRMPGLSGIELLQAIKHLPAGQNTDVVLMTGHGGLDTAIQAMRSGAYDYLLKPVNIEELALVAERVAEHQKLRRENCYLREHLADEVQEATAATRDEIQRLRTAVRSEAGLAQFGVFSPQMRQVTQRCLQYHRDRSLPVLIQGETGTGKELLARLIHYGEDAAMAGPFVDVNCAALTPSLFESELFGYAAGSFTGGLAKGRKGKLDAAMGGTLFLDEIGDMPPELQAKLLRVIQEREFYRVGGLEKIPADVRFICATHVDLQQRVQTGQFREDLLFRLRVGTVVAPPLRERPEEILPLAKMFLAEFAKQKKKHFTSISREVADCLMKHNWPGNVRELRNVIEAAVVLFDDEILRGEHLVLLEPQPRRKPSGEQSTVSAQTESPQSDSGFVAQAGAARVELPDNAFQLEKLHYEILRKAVKRFDGNVTRAAQYLGISPRTLSYRLKAMGKEFGLDDEKT
ncbi:MAG: sigma-54-dependent Fis family transcriptional regulator [Veillonellaceae bacterium]|nr:sigma-54-dependent Fis family transcriptional regulator [Veillonellaceae bacterium]